MSQDFMQVPDGKYCGLNLFYTMTLLQSDLKQGSAFDWTCKANEPNEMDCETKTSCHDGPDPSPTAPTSTPFTDSDQNEPITKPTPDTDTCAGPRPTYCRAFGRESCESDVGCYWHYGGFCVDGFCSQAGCYGKKCTSFNGYMEGCLNHGCEWHGKVEKKRSWSKHQSLNDEPRYIRNCFVARRGAAAVVVSV